MRAVQFHRPAHQRFTLIELLVVVAIIAVLAAMLLPALGKAREKVQFTACANNQHQIVLSLTMYTDDFSSYYPPTNALFYNNSATVTAYHFPTWINWHAITTGTTAAVYGHGRLSTFLGKYSPDPAVYHCPLAPTMGINMIRQQYLNPDLDSCNSDYSTWWNWSAGTTFKAPVRDADANSDLLLSDKVIFANGDTNTDVTAPAIYWFSSHRPKEPAVPYARQGPTGYQFGWDCVGTGTVVPTLSYNAAYRDGHVELTTTATTTVLSGNAGVGSFLAGASRTVAIPKHQ